ncbi:citrate lyase acyl carrier protein [Neobacillus ginsengisoli]|uniref:Citrate lyase acyl carrier protein n=1 Tax=Neobacillus ginsengisoli TaxID=904295 RepID=A0ABT9XUN8_9BACI|nr:citrate lyase acyl carrier protein [Neobacillus ginsengisoli]MDQ0199281.1 citrate lyase subunit gamma (acyl carrier protein) [Neobacillus ginsengisoli]
MMILQEKLNIQDVGIAGTLESSDITIQIEKNEGHGIELALKSSVENQFGKQIKKVILETLLELGVENAVVLANDKGALDCTIRARVITAVSRATYHNCFPWEVK